MFPQTVMFGGFFIMGVVLAIW